ncbi:SDR family NAD(P)-dependent oxidoreductase [Secundilactobacillus kimchicus]|uniref:SDR family oxidoreductase n=1 Tax=Secundilactobacillus kimchicus TaxID=528209 RepID=UPI001C031122|nr:SDR family oxidoreductase [Secundilactobacillus kimchicus]MBT9671133.1 SDR family NAD(P)-dependent oxidoreductase [Secundilactobacillus kimchicus]
MTVQNKVVVITGASSGIGLATARKLAGMGAKLVLGARREDRLKQLAAEFDSGQVLYAKTDVTVREDVTKLVNLAQETFGRVDVMFNNAGLMPLSLLDELKVSEWEKMIDTNIKGVLYGIAAVLPIMINQKGGHVITTDSVAGHIVRPSTAVYAGTKYAIQAIMDGLRQEQVENHIRTTMISPGVVNTELYSTISGSDRREEMRKQEQGMGIQPEDVANAVAYAIDQPEAVGINEILLRPVAQQH